MHAPHVYMGLGYRLRTLFRPSVLDRNTRMRRVAGLLNLSKPARARLEWMLWYEGPGRRNALATARRFGIASKTFWKWRKLFDAANLRSLEDRPRIPHRRRVRELTPLQEQRIIVLKRAHIRYGKEKISRLYAAAYGEPISAWKVQKVIERYRLYYHPIRQARINRKRRRSVKRKKITDLKIRQRSGFLLCLDTIVLYWVSAKRYIFTAVDRHTKLAFARMYPTKSARNAADFLRRLHLLLDGKIENVGHDQGSEFRASFAATCQDLGITPYVSRIKTPKDNATNERFNRTLQEEFVQLDNLTADVPEFNRRLTEWLIEYNFRRPHQSLGYLSPINFIYRYQRLLPMYPSSTRI